MKQESAVFRRELDRIVTRRGPCVPRELRERVSAWLAAQRAMGRSVSDLAIELGLARGTVMRWSSEAKSSKAIVPVRVVQEAEAHTVAVVSPSGFRVEGVTVSEAAAMLRALG